MIADPISQEIIEYIIERGLKWGAKFIIANKHLFSLALFLTSHRDDDVRVSISTIARVSLPGDKQLLIKSIRRPNQYGPFGGVVRCTNVGLEKLKDKFVFIPELSDESANDLRGFIKGRHLGPFIKWLGEGRHIERDTIYREFDEELNEARITFGGIKDLFFDDIYSVMEGPTKINGKRKYYQFRIFRILELRTDEGSGLTLVKLLSDIGTSNKSILKVSSADIIRGHTLSGLKIAGHTGYLLSKKKLFDVIGSFQEINGN